MNERKKIKNKNKNLTRSKFPSNRDVHIFLDAMERLYVPSFWCFFIIQTYMHSHSNIISHPHLLVPSHQRTVSTSKGCKQWLSLTKTLLKVTLVGGNRSLVARTSKCGWAISVQIIAMLALGTSTLGAPMTESLPDTEGPK